MGRQSRIDRAWEVPTDGFWVGTRRRRTLFVQAAWGRLCSCKEIMVMGAEVWREPVARGQALAEEAWTITVMYSYCRHFFEKLPKQAKTGPSQPWGVVRWKRKTENKIAAVLVSHGTCRVVALRRAWLTTHGDNVKGHSDSGESPASFPVRWQAPHWTQPSQREQMSNDDGEALHRPGNTNAGQTTNQNNIEQRQQKNLAKAGRQQWPASICHWETVMPRLWTRRSMTRLLTSTTQMILFVYCGRLAQKLKSLATDGTVAEIKDRTSLTGPRVCST